MSCRRCSGRDSLNNIFCRCPMLKIQQTCKIEEGNPVVMQSKSMLCKNLPVAMQKSSWIWNMMSKISLNCRLLPLWNGAFICGQKGVKRILDKKKRRSCQRCTLLMCSSMIGRFIKKNWIEDMVKLGLASWLLKVALR